MKMQAENEPYSDINITPMLDLAYVLLVIFIMMTTATVQGVCVNLPKAITVAADGTIYLDTFPVTMDEPETRLRQCKVANPALPVVIKGDAAVQYDKVIEVLDLLGRMDITQLGLVTQRLVK